MDLTINTMKTKKSKIKNRTLMNENIIMPHPSNTLISAGPGSGKTCLLVNLLQKGEFYGPSLELLTDEQKKKGPRSYFDAIFLFLPSGDDAYDPLIKKKLIMPYHICVNPTSDVLDNVIKTQKKAIELAGDISKAPKILCIFDDCVREKKMLESAPFKTLFTQSRHINISNIVTTQYLNLVPKSVRMMCDSLICFKLNRLEIDLLSDAYCPPLMSKQNFKEMVHSVTSDTNDNKHNFLMICRKVSDINKKFRKNFDCYIKVEDQCTLPAPRYSKKKENEFMKKDDDDDVELKEMPFDPIIEDEMQKDYRKSNETIIPFKDNKSKKSIPNNMFNTQNRTTLFPQMMG